MKLSNHVEALLFTSGEPLTVLRLTKILGKEEAEIEDAITELETELQNRGVKLIKKGKEIMLGASPDCSKYCETLLKEELDKNIGRAGLETLSVILYKGALKKDGVSRSEIDYIRGVNSTFTLRNLMIRGLVERKPNSKDKRSFIYTPSMQLLQYLGITKTEDLPEYNNFIKKINDAEEFSNNN